MTAALEVENLSFAYPRGPEILHGLSFAVEEGERVGILGANGAGKSTLVWCLAGILKGTGSIRVFGQNLRDSRSRVGVVFQNPEDQLFMPTLVQDLTLPLINRGIGLQAATNRASEVLREVELEHSASQPASQLSLGQRKRAAIAAALVTEPEILLLDEPTAELDNRSARLLSELLLRLDKTLLVASHDTEFVRKVASRVLILCEGSVLARGETGLLQETEVLVRAHLI